MEVIDELTHAPPATFNVLRTAKFRGAFSSTDWGLRGTGSAPRPSQVSPPSALSVPIGTQRGGKGTNRVPEGTTSRPNGTGRAHQGPKASRLLLKRPPTPTPG